MRIKPTENIPRMITLLCVCKEIRMVVAVLNQYLFIFLEKKYKNIQILILFCVVKNLIAK